MTRFTALLTLLSGLLFAAASLAETVKTEPAANRATLLTLSEGGSLPVRYGPLPADIEPENAVLVVRGVVTGAATAELLLRIDDRNATSYATRFNSEQRLPPGPFEIRLPLAGLTAANHQPLDIGNIRKIILFGRDGMERVKIDSVVLEAVARLAKGASGYSFGAATSPLFEGFSRITAKDPRLSGKYLQEILRPGVDPLIASGISGIEHVRLRETAGKHRVTLWTEETSAWESLRSFGKRRITINGSVVRTEEYTPESWLQSRYFSGRDREVGADADIWENYGRHRGGALTYDVEIGPDGLLAIDLAGFGATALYLSAILIEPAGIDALSAVNQRRKTWFTNRWTVDSSIGDSIAPDAEITLESDAVPDAIDLALTATSGTGLHLALLSAKAQGTTRLSVHWREPLLDRAIETLIWTGQRRLERVRTGGNLFTPRSASLRADGRAFGLHAGIPRRFALWFNPKEPPPPGVHSGTLRIEAGGLLREQRLRLIVPPIALPEARHAAGFYLQTPAHLLWEKSLRSAGEAQNRCDLAFLAKLGITGNAPALRPPLGDALPGFLRDTQQALQFANAEPWLAYQAGFELRRALGVEKGAIRLAEAEAALGRENLPAPVWSMADEPSNAESGGTDPGAWVAAVRRAAPAARLAGHLNSKADKSYAPLFDVAIINAGFGIDIAEIKSLQKQKVIPWLYNTDAPRLTAGLWLWLSGAERYLQWHARLPLGDPFDPTDGREGDVSMFPPMPLVCAPQPDIHVGMIEMADGLIDQRFFRWLETQNTPEAQKLLAIIQRTFLKTLSGDWEKARAIPREQLNSLRIAIAKLALHLNGTEEK
ncbi:MAG: hypothetical protein H2045_10140 [Rhizobiales bacterium]|nr:hypothetical protein [Hyphomicrobiales bacterium]